jgi:type II secretory pathway component PulC
LLSAIGAGAVVVAAIWGANIPRERWFAWFKREEVPAATAQELASKRVAEVVAKQQSPAATDEHRLHLVSTSPGRNAFEGTAALGADITHPQILSAGALLQNGTTLKEIYADHVVLERDGKRVDLYVEGIALSAKAKPVRANSDLLALDDNQPVTKPAKSSPATYTEIVRAAPHYSESELIGFDVYPGTSAGQFSRLGLQAGDILTAIDGAPIKTHEELAAALEDISEGRSVLAYVIRGGQEMQISIDGSSLIQNTQAMASAAPMP